MSEPVLARLLGATRRVTVAPGDRLLEEGEAAASLFVVLEGELEICKRGRNGAEFCLAVLRAGDCVGEMSLIDIQPRSATVRAVSAATLLTLDNAAIARLYGTDLEVYTLLVLNIAREISRRLRQADQALVDVALAVQGQIPRAPEESSAGVSIPASVVRRLDGKDGDPMTTTTNGFRAPDLLNEDGSASMATMFMTSHHGMRRDLARFAATLPTAGDPERAAALRDEWQKFRTTLHHHHEAEDHGVFPMVRAQSAELAAVVDQLAADHRRIDPLLAEGDRAFDGLPASSTAALGVVAQLAALLDEHLAIEELRVVPHLRDAREFPPPANDAEAEMYAQGFAWSLHGIAPEVAERVVALLPPILTAKLPAARAAFAERCTRVWGSADAGASRTSVPDWLKR
jgi:CRP-like cAMP-binding protein